MSDEVRNEFVIKGKDAHGTGYFSDDGFVVKAGSMARKHIVPSARKVVPAVHAQLTSDGVLEEENGQLRFTRDHTFNAPSGAAMAILGRTANGWKEWRLPDGTTLNDVKRVPVAGALDPEKRRQIIQKHEQLAADGKILSDSQLETYYSLFRQRFGPDVLRSLSGEALLNLVHDHSNRDSLVYWLEFKNDDEFETKRFGSIAGGSALKFGIFRRKETGEWQAADSSNNPTDISVEEAVETATRHRDQLLRGLELMEMLPADASDEEYAELQESMNTEAPDVSDLAWGHKYFSMLFPDKLDDYHVSFLQRFHLLKMLQLPPESDGRYLCAGRFIRASNEVGLPITTFGTVLNAIHGARHRYWRIGTRSGSSNESHWQMMQDRGRVAIGWNQLGDLSWVEAKPASREKLKALLAEKHPKNASTIGRNCTQITNFVAKISEGDLVWAADGATILGVGRVVGDYEFSPEFDFPHQRKVDWLNLDEWKMPIHEGLRTTVKEIKKHRNLLETERRIQQQSDKPDESESKTIVKRTVRLSGVAGRIQSIVERKGQVILYGPPGTGKTYWAERTARDLAAMSAFGVAFSELQQDKQLEVLGNDETAGLVRLCCFHPAYGYEDFLEGYRPHTVNDQVSFELRDGIFKKLCDDAATSPQRNFYLIVDEINRGDIPRIFGELLTTLERDKRGKRIVLPVSQDAFSVPQNVFLIGTMNTADRSISLLDAALRRRFGFVEMMPDSTVLKESAVGGIPLRSWFDSLNSRIREHVGRDARNLQIGHSYLMQSGSPIKELASLKRAIRDDIIPLLEEYCYEDYSTLERILGDQIIDSSAQRIRQELFDDGQEDDLVQALLAPCPEISTTSDALAAEESEDEEDESDDDI